jgi:hypothetical protein
MDRKLTLHGRFLHDDRGSVAVGYVFVVAFAIAIAFAVVGLRLPIRAATKASIPLAENTP